MQLVAYIVYYMVETYQKLNERAHCQAETVLTFSNQIINSILRLYNLIHEYSIQEKIPGLSAQY